MREIRFKGYCKDRKVWIYFTLSDLDLGLLSIPFDELDIIVQFTGLKDKNGIDIYEGDIIQFIDSLDDARLGKFQVSFNNGGFQIDDEDNSFLIDLNMDEHEVIGNIYENSELLEEEK